MIVTIDGPAGAGKSTVASRLAERLGFRYLDTGRHVPRPDVARDAGGIDLEDGDQLGALARENPVDLDESGRVVDRRHRRHLGDPPVADRPPGPVVARHPEVREVMRERQRELAELGDAVIEGRDIGTVVCPDADVKVYLVADRGSARSAARPSGRTSAPTRSPPTSALRDESDARACSRPRTRR